MKIIFMGSAEFACPSLRLLIESARDAVVGIVSQPERPKGRMRKIGKCPVDEYASSGAFRIFTPKNVNADESVEALRAQAPDLIVVVAYGQILKPAMLALAPKGCINLHASLLPKYRGAAPIQWSIARGEKKTGVTTMFLNEKMDEGDIIAQDEELVSDTDTSATLGARLAERGAKLLMDTIEMIRRGTAPRIKQDAASASYAPRLRKTDGLIDWNRPAGELADRIRGFQPWPCCYLTLKDKTTARVMRARVEADRGGKPGEILEACGEGPLIQAVCGSLRLLELQPEGKKPMTGAAFLCGNKLSVGDQVDRNAFSTAGAIISPTPR